MLLICCGCFRQSTVSVAYEIVSLLSFYQIILKGALSLFNLVLILVVGVYSLTGTIVSLFISNRVIISCLLLFSFYSIWDLIIPYLLLKFLSTSWWFVVQCMCAWNQKQKKNLYRFILRFIYSNHCLRKTCRLMFFSFFSFSLLFHVIPSWTIYLFSCFFLVGSKVSCQLRRNVYFMWCSQF